MPRSNAWLNLLFCAGVVILCVSGFVMWWKRRPAGRARLIDPPLPGNVAVWKAGVALMCVLGVLFPLTGGVMLVVCCWMHGWCLVGGGARRC